MQPLLKNLSFARNTETQKHSRDSTAAQYVESDGGLEDGQVTSLRENTM